MTQLTIELSDADYQRLEQLAQRIGKAVQTLAQEWIQQLLPELDETYDVTQDSVYQMEGYDSEAPSDLSVHLDQYLYGQDLCTSGGKIISERPLHLESLRYAQGRL